MLFPTLELSSLPVVVARPDERLANRSASVLEWNDSVCHLVQTKIKEKISYENFTQIKFYHMMKQSGRNSAQ